jgi:hypothetical protein
MLFRPRVVRLGLLLGVVAAIGLGLAAKLDARRNPRLREPSTWTVDDVQTLLEDPALHWCDGYHGHTADRGLSWRCKGRRLATFRALEGRFRGDGRVEELVLHRLGDRDARVAACAAELLGEWRVARAEAPLLGHLGRRLNAMPGVSSPPYYDQQRALAMVWALERLTSARELQALEPGAAVGSSFVRDALRHAIETLRAGRACACRAPSRH